MTKRVEPKAYIPRAIWAPNPDKPFMIWAAPPFLFFYGVTSLLWVFLLAWDRVANPKSDISFIGLAFSGAGTLLIMVVAYGLLHEKAWARILMTTVFSWFFVATGIVTGIVAPQSQTTGSLLQGAITLALSWWYFYAHAPVTAYYRRIENEAMQHAPAPPSP